jgi:HK97 family phage major capsid protein
MPRLNLLLERTADPELYRREERDFFKRLSRKGDDARQGGIILRDTAELRALSVTQFTGGGATIPENFSDRLEAALKWASPIRAQAEVVRTEDGADYPWPTSNDVANEGVLLTENTVETETDMSFAVVVLRSFKFSSQRVNVPQELVEDSPLLASQLGRLLGLRIGRLQNRHFTVGTGAGQSRGVVGAAPVGATSASPTLITGDDLLALIDSVDPAYRENGRFQLHQDVWKLVAGLKDGNGRYVFPQNTPGQRVLHGYPVSLNPHMSATVAAGNITVLFGDFSFVKIRDVRELRLKAYTEAAGLAENDQTAYSAVLRSDAALLDAGTGPVKSLVQHA